MDASRLHLAFVSPSAHLGCAGVIVYFCPPSVFHSLFGRRNGGAWFTGARNLLDEVMSRRKEDAKKAEEELDRRMEEILARMNVPTKSDIDALSEKISRLTEKVDELQQNGSE